MQGRRQRTFRNNHYVIHRTISTSVGHGGNKYSAHTTEQARTTKESPETTTSGNITRPIAKVGLDSFRLCAYLTIPSNRTAKAPWMPGFSLAFRMLLLLRFSAAMYSNIQDCDEGMLKLNTSFKHFRTEILVYNFWEPLHYLDRGIAFQTWELSPQYAIRSWAYIILHLWPAWVSTHLLSLDKVPIKCRLLLTNH